MFKRLLSPVLFLIFAIFATNLEVSASCLAAASQLLAPVQNFSAKTTTMGDFAERMKVRYSAVSQQRIKEFLQQWIDETNSRSGYLNGLSPEDNVVTVDELFAFLKTRDRSDFGRFYAVYGNLLNVHLGFMDMFGAESCLPSELMEKWVRATAGVLMIENYVPDPALLKPAAWEAAIQEEIEFSKSFSGLGNLENVGI